MKPIVLCLLFGQLVFGCAHTGAVANACAEKVTPDLEAAAAAALVGDDYEAAIARAFAGAAACLATAAVEAAIAEARRVKLEPAGGARQAAIELHGQAWLSRHAKG